MNKQNFIALADHIRAHKSLMGVTPFDTQQIETLADFCQAQNAQFKRDRWLDYIAGKCGKNGGKVK